MLHKLLTTMWSGIFLCAVLNATTYNCATFSVPGATSTRINGINNAGTIAGAYTAGGVSHGFIGNASSSSFQTIDYPGSTNTQLFTINNSGVVTGEYNFPATSTQTPGWFTRDAAGNFSPITVPSGYTLSLAYGINDNGAISVKVTNSTGGTVFGILNPDGTLTPVPNASGASEFTLGPASLNVAGQMLEVDPGFGVTYLVDTGGNKKLIFGGGLPVPPSDGFGINNSGLIVGYYIGFVDQGPFVGVSRDPSGVYSELLCQGSNPFRNSGPRWQGVNDNGVVVGDTTIATPVSGEPQVSLSATSITFPPTPVGQTTAPQSVTITNTGNARLDIAGTRTTSSDFAASGCAAAAPVSLDPGASCTVMVTAKPSAQGSRTGTLLIDDSAIGSPQTVALSVTGTVPPPSCVISGENPGPPEQLTFTMQDTNSGLKSIVLMDATNATASIPPFASGTTSPVTVTATQSNSSQSSKVDFQVTNVQGGATTCGATFGGATQWTSLGGSVTSKIAVARNTDGRLQAFVRASDNALWTLTQAAPDGGWGSWVSLGGILSSDPVVGVNQDGRLQVFVLGTDSAIWTIAQSAPGGGFSGWQSLGGTLISDPAVAKDGNGDLEVVSVGGDSGLWQIAQTSPGGSWSGWNPLGGGIQNNPALIANQDGRLQTFVIGLDNTELWTNSQISPGGPWSGWMSLGGSFSTDPVVTINQDGRLQVFLMGTDNALFTVAQLTPGGGGGWSGFTSLGGIISSNPAVTINSDGRLEAFVRGQGNNELWHLSQTTPGGSWSAWATLNGTIQAPIGTAQNQDGRVAAFVEGGDSGLWTIEQTAPGFWN